MRARVGNRLWLFSVEEAGCKRWVTARGTRDAVRVVDEMEGEITRFDARAAKVTLLSERAGMRATFYVGDGTERPMLVEARREPVRRYVAVSEF